MAILDRVLKMQEMANKLNIIIVGAGGFGREVCQWVHWTYGYDKYKIKGFLDCDSNKLKGYDIVPPIIGNDDYDIQDKDRFIIAIGNVAIKKKVVEKLKKRGAQFIRLVHPTAIVSYNSHLGDGVVICPYSVVTDSVEIGDFAMLNIYSSCGHDSKVGKYSIMSPYATLNGGAELKDEVFMGTRATVVGSKTIEKESIIGAHSLALHDVPEKTKVLGVSTEDAKNG